MKKNSKTFSETFANMLQVINEDHEINTRVVQLLKLDSFRRRLVLNKWLEQLRRKGATHKLMQALSCLLDNEIAEKTLSLLKTKNHNN